MSEVQIARVDAIPLLFAWMQTMDVAGQIDAHWTTHRAWEGLSYGQLAVLFLMFLIHERDHRLSALEPWVLAHHATLTAVTGWTIRREDVTDDRLGHMLGVIGMDPAQITVMQQALGRHLVRAYALPTSITAFGNLAHFRFQKLNVVSTEQECALPVVRPRLNSLLLVLTLKNVSSSAKADEDADLAFFRRM